MVAQITFTRESDNQTFTFSSLGPYQLTPSTLLPDASTLDVSGIEYTGVAGGVTLASRLQRQTVKLVYNVREWYSDSRSLTELVAAGSAFFRPMKADLTAEKYTMTVYTADSKKSVWMMRHGAVSVPFDAGLLRGHGLSVNNEMDLIFDDPLRYWAGNGPNGSGSITLKLTPLDDDKTIRGESWSKGLQAWTNGLSDWLYPSAGGGVAQTVNLVSNVPVNCSIQLFGGLINPIVTNLTNGSKWQWVGEIPDGKSITVSDDGTATDWTGKVLWTATGQLSAVPGDNTFQLEATLPKSTLSAKWSGTANDSTSMLVEGGNTMATNLLRDPKPLAASYTPNVSTVTIEDTPAGMKITDGSGGDPAANGGVYTLPAGSYHLHAEMGDVSGTTWNDMILGLWGFIQPMEADLNANILDFDATLASDMPSTTFEVKCPKWGYAIWQRLGLYSAADWQYMQLHNTTYFDGDSVFFDNSGYAQVSVRGAF